MEIEGGIDFKIYIYPASFLKLKIFDTFYNCPNWKVWNWDDFTEGLEKNN